MQRSDASTTTRCLHWLTLATSGPCTHRSVAAVSRIVLREPPSEPAEEGAEVAMQWWSKFVQIRGRRRPRVFEVASASTDLNEDGPPSAWRAEAECATQVWSTRWFDSAASHTQDKTATFRGGHGRGFCAASSRRDHPS